MAQPLPPPICRLADRLLENGIAAFIEEQRTAGRSWGALARELYIRTNHEIDVTGPTVTAWARQLEIATQRPDAEKAAS